MVQPNHFRTRNLIRKMASNGIADILPQLLRSIALREDGRTHGVGGQATLRILFDDEDQFRVHPVFYADPPLVPVARAYQPLL